jgi:hypothetical protein
MRIRVGAIHLLLLACAAPAFSNVAVMSPTTGTQVSSPFTLQATATPCSSQAISAMGYSFDNSTNTTIVYSTSVNAAVGAPIGAHVLHVKSWGNQGASCVTDVAITVVATPLATAPSNAVAVYGIQKQYVWQGVSDGATGSGLASGGMSLAGSPALSGAARRFSISYKNSGGERFWAVFGADKNAKNFLYDAQVYIASPSNDIANIEMDMNQVMANGQTVIFGFQCDGYTETWDYTTNAGTPERPVDQWLHSSVPCNPRTWATGVWHHIQIAYSRDDEGNATYKYVTFDGVQKMLNETTNSAFALGWGPTLLTNFQIDGLGGYGSATVYVDNLTVYRW